MDLNLPNALTFLRILMIPVFMALLLESVPHGAGLAATVFVLAAATDSLDGWVARRRQQKTVLGTFLDPLADKLLVSAALIALVQLDKVSAWIVMVIIAREFAVSGLRVVAAAESVVIPASRWGKVKTASQMLAIVALILAPRTVLGVRLDPWLVALAVILTVVSGADYFLKAREHLYAPSEREVGEVPVPASAVEDDRPGV